MDPPRTLRELLEVLAPGLVDGRTPSGTTGRRARGRPSTTSATGRTTSLPPVPSAERAPCNPVCALRRHGDARRLGRTGAGRTGQGPTSGGLRREKEAYKTTNP